MIRISIFVVRLRTMWLETISRRLKSNTNQIYVHVLFIVSYHIKVRRILFFQTQTIVDELFAVIVTLAEMTIQNRLNSSTSERSFQ